MQSSLFIATTTNDNRRMRAAPFALLLLVPSDSAAHPGGTDRFGCHVESATGIRHCHNGDGEGGTPPVLTAMLGAEFGSSFRSYREGEEITYFGSAYLQHDGSMLFLANVGGHYPRRRGTTVYGDLGLGIAWLARTDLFVAAQVAIGVRVPLVYLNEHDRAPYFKVGVFMDLIADDNDAETIGLAAAVGFTL